jgi:hypothetical protein
MSRGTMINFEELSDGDRIRIETEVTDASLFDVSDVAIEDIGLTKVFAVTLLTDDLEAYAIEGTLASDSVTFTSLKGELEEEIDVKAIEIKKT